MTLADALDWFAAGAARRAEPLHELVGWVDADLGYMTPIAGAA